MRKPGLRSQESGRILCGVRIGKNFVWSHNLEKFYVESESGRSLCGFGLIINGSFMAKLGG